MTDDRLEQLITTVSRLKARVEKLEEAERERKKAQRPMPQPQRPVQPAFPNRRRFPGMMPPLMG